MKNLESIERPAEVVAEAKELSIELPKALWRFQDIMYPRSVGQESRYWFSSVRSPLYHKSEAFRLKTDEWDLKLGLSFLNSLELRYWYRLMHTWPSGHQHWALEKFRERVELEELCELHGISESHPAITG